MKGCYPNNQDTAYFVFTRGGNYPWFTADALDVAMPCVLVTYRYNVGGMLTQ
jgi:hypothetical protein